MKRRDLFKVLSGVFIVPFISKENKVSKKKLETKCSKCNLFYNTVCSVKQPVFLDASTGKIICISCQVEEDSKKLTINSSGQVIALPG